MANDLASEGDVIQSSPEAETSSAEIGVHPGPSAETNVSATTVSKCGLPTINEGCCEDSPVVDIEDLLTPNEGEFKTLIPVTEDLYDKVSN